jgi:hypothetical protein
MAHILAEMQHCQSHNNCDLSPFEKVRRELATTELTMSQKFEYLLVKVRYHECTWLLQSFPVGDIID